MRIREGKPWLPALQILGSFFRNLVVRRHLIWNFAVRDLKIRYVGSMMGFFWAVVHPLVLLLSYTFVFSIVFQVRPHTSATDNFALFLFCGILPWLYFQDTVLRCCGSVVENRNLIRKTVFPSEILPVSLVISNLVTHLVGVALLLVVLSVSGLLYWTVFLLPFYWLVLMILALGLGWLAAALQVFLRDTLQVLSVILVFWFWLTPIFYSVEMVPAPFQPLIRINPMTGMVNGFRFLLLEHQTPEVSGTLHLVATALLLFVLGGLVFRSTKREFVDVL